jgi:hypothetical protein
MGPGGHAARLGVSERGRAAAVVKFAEVRPNASDAEVVAQLGLAGPVGGSGGALLRCLTTRDMP